MFFSAITSTKKKTAGVNTCKYIIVHHTAWWTFASNLRYLSEWTAQASVHYIVWPDGEIGKIGQDTDILWHAWQSQRGTLSDMNKYSIWIEVVWPDYWKYSKVGFSEEQKKDLWDLIIYLMKEHNIPIENVLRHKDVAPWRKTDIADSFWNTEYSSWQDYLTSLFLTKNSMTEENYKSIYENAIKETWVSPIFTNFSKDAQVKYLLWAWLARLEFKIKENLINRIKEKK
jgi:N-acetyl-anhydromuramyl-L-alanine amidase AmpD